VLDDLTFEIARGSAVGLMGPSGCGKSALLKVLSGLIPPTAGRLEMYGSVTSLLTAGGGIDGNKTAVENVRASSAYKALPAESADALLAEMIAFAEIESFERAPMRTFSTGMTLRFAAALALCGAPDVVLIDDVLAVGDIGFQQKLVERIHALKASGATLVIASHDEAFVQQVATRVVTLSEGRIVYDSADQDSALALRTHTNADLDWQITRALPEDDVVRFLAIEGEAVQAGSGTCFDLRMAVVGKSEGLSSRPVVSVYNDEGVVLFRSLYPAFVPLSRDPVRFSVRVPTQLLPGGRYQISIAAATRHDGRAFATKSSSAVALTVRRQETPAPEEGAAPVLRPPVDWKVEPLVEGQPVEVS
jgi:ABC-type polysaccharide/polyol phosphate transport system ATPase subunit